MPGHAPVEGTTYADATTEVNHGRAETWHRLGRLGSDRRFLSAQGGRRPNGKTRQQSHDVSGARLVLRRNDQQHDDLSGLQRD